MRRIIINYDDDIGANLALVRVLKVIEEGKISEACGVPHYCWCTGFFDCRVFTLPKRLKRDGTRTETDSFEVRNRKEENDNG